MKEEKQFDNEHLTKARTCDPQIVGEELEKLLPEIDGKLTADNTLEYARRNEDFELHKCFEWDDKIAGERYRLRQAEAVLRNLAVAAVVPKFTVEAKPNCNNISPFSRE